MLNSGQFFIGVVEDRNDHLKLGRCKVRVVGLHTHDKSALPTVDLPWAMPMQPVTGASSGGIGHSAIGPVEGTTVIVIFHDYPDCQQPIMIGALGGLPQAQQVLIDEFNDEPLFKDSITPNGRLAPTTAVEATANHVGPVIVENPYLSSLVNQGTSASTTTGLGVMQTLVGGSAVSLGSVGMMSGTVSGLGTIYDAPQNAFEDLLLTTGDSEAAINEFVTIMSTGLIGEALGPIIEGNSLLISAFDELGLPNIDLSFVFDDLIIDPIMDELDLDLGLETEIEGVVTDIISSILDVPSIVQPSAIDLSSIQYGSQLPAMDPDTQVLMFNPIGRLSTSSYLEAGIAEGQSRPIYGKFGGPNAAAPQFVSPTPPVIDTSRYGEGSSIAVKTEPPLSWVGDRLKASAGIAALIRACDKYGLTTSEQKAALLGIVGGECGWIPSAESAQYSSPERLCQIFQSTFKGDLNLASDYCNWIKDNKGTREQFFDFVYDPANNGRQLGNLRPGDGGRYYGRGFIQLTGLANYERYATLSKYDIVNNPDILITNLDASAEVAVLYLLDRTKHVIGTAHPGYFYAAKRAVGNNSPDIAARKLEYYEHFYGLKTPESYGYTDKVAGNVEAPYSYNGAIVECRPNLSSVSGFCDPNNKYPLKRYINEPDTNRLARGVAKETIVTLKDSKRTLNVPMAMDSGSFSQPTIPYGAQYPYNKVLETESGHVQEFDDTPGYERIHTYHRSGTFQEIDANGTEVKKIVGDGYTIIDRNGYISIDGECAITVGGNVNIFCRSDANIEVAGSAEMKVGGNFDIGVARDMNIAVGGTFSVWANTGMNLQCRNMMHVLCKDDMFISAEGSAHIKSQSGMRIDAFTLEVNSSDSTVMNANSEFHIKSQNSAFIESVASMNIKAGANVEIDGQLTNINSGTAQPALTPFIAHKALIHGMTPPENGIPLYPNIERMSSPVLAGEETFMYELPEDGGSQTSKIQMDYANAQSGIPNTTQSVPTPAIGGGGSIVMSDKLNIILATGEFTADFRLSEHFTLGMMFDGGFNVRHRLVNQNGLTQQQIVANLALLCENILEKYLAVLPGGILGLNKRWKINSGYRMGISNSDHGKGRAVDIGLIGGPERKALHHELIQQLDKIVQYDQLILEYRGADSTWIHTGFRGDGSTTFGEGSNRKMAFTMNNDKTVAQGFVLLG